MLWWALILDVAFHQLYTWPYRLVAFVGFFRIAYRVWETRTTHAGKERLIAGSLALSKALVLWSLGFPDLTGC